MLSKEEKRESLRRCRLFTNLEPTALAVLAEVVEEELFGRDEEVCEAGEAAERVYVIHSGTLAVFLPGTQAPVRKMHAGDVFGEYGLVTGTRTTTIRATEDTVMLSLDYERFRSFLLRYPSALFELFGVTVRRLTEAEEKLRRANRRASDD